MSKPLKRMMTVCAVMVGLMVGGVSVPSAYACEPLDPISAAQVEIEWQRGDVERSMAALTEAVEKDDKEAIAGAAKRLIQAHKSLAEAEERLEIALAEDMQRQKELATFKEHSKK